MEGENYMKKRGRVLILLITAALAIEPLQLVYAEPAVDNLTGTVSQETGAEIRDENESAQPEPKPGWVSVERDTSGGRRMVVSFSSLDGLRSRVRNIIFRKVVFVIPDGRPLSRRNAIIYLTVSLPRNDG